MVDTETEVEAHTYILNADPKCFKGHNLNNNKNNNILGPAVFLTCQVAETMSWLLSSIIAYLLMLWHHLFHCHHHNYNYYIHIINALCGYCHNWPYIFLSSALTVTLLLQPVVMLVMTYNKLVTVWPNVVVSQAGETRGWRWITSPINATISDNYKLVELLNVFKFVSIELN